MVRLANQMFPKRWSEQTPIKDLVNAMLEEDSDALTVAAETGKWLGRGMALLVDAFNPQMIVHGSLAVVFGKIVLAPARSELAKEALPQALAMCEVLPAALGKRIGDVAALNRPAIFSNLEAK